MTTPVMDFSPMDIMYDNVRLCTNCEYKDNKEKCPLLMKEPKPIFGRGASGPYTASWAREDIRYEHSCHIHRYGARDGDKPTCKLTDYASCEACSKEWNGCGTPPCCPY